MFSVDQTSLVAVFLSNFTKHFNFLENRLLTKFTVPFNAKTQINFNCSCILNVYSLRLFTFCGQGSILFLTEKPRYFHAS